jgi:hypothetical protein
VLVDFLRRHKTHGGPRHRFTNAFGIMHVVFVRLDLGFGKLGRHKFHFMVMVTESSSPVMRPATDLHPDEHRGQGGDKGQQGIAGKALAQDDLAPLIYLDNMKDPLGDVDSQYAHRVFHQTRLLWWNGFTGLEIVLAY